MPLALFGILIYESVKEYKNNPVEFKIQSMTMILLLSISIIIIIYFWSNYHKETPKIKPEKETIKILR